MGPATPTSARRRSPSGSAPILRSDDVVFSTHRGHGHALAKGVEPRALAAELFGRSTGCSHGRGGSMHLFAPEIGLMGTSGIVGPCILQAAGAGYSFKLLESDRVAVAFFGDGAVNNGAFHEGLNMASIWKLPVLFVCENNEFATEVPFQYASRQPERRGPGRGLRPARRRGRRQRRARRVGRRSRGHRPRPGRRRGHADRVQDLSHPSPRRGDGRLHVPHARGRRAVEGPLPDPAVPRPPSGGCGPRRGRAGRDRRGGRGTDRRGHRASPSRAPGPIPPPRPITSTRSRPEIGLRTSRSATRRPLRAAAS